MNTDPFMTLDMEPLRRRRYWYVLAFALVIVSLLVQHPLVFLAAFFAFVLGIVPNLWYRTALRHLIIQQQLSQEHLFFGEDVVLSITIENQKLLPLPWLRIENRISPVLTTLNTKTAKRETISQLSGTWQFWSLQRVTRHYRMQGLMRGSYTFGPVSLRSSDPFGWLESEVSVPVFQTLLVYPLIAPLEAFGLSSLHPFGEHATSRHLLEDPLRVAGVRDYQLGDDPRRIHWKATAHTGTLRSKIYEYSNQRRILILLDAWNYSRDWTGIDREIQELSISVAASLAVWALDEGYMVGLLSTSAMITSMSDLPLAEQAIQHDASDLYERTSTHISAPGVRVPFARDHGQYVRLLSMLASLVPYHHIPMETFLASEDRMFPVGTTVIMVSAISTLNEATVETLLDLNNRGVALHLLLTGNPDKTTRAETYDLPVHYPGGRETWHELLTAEHASTLASPLHLQLD